MKVLHLPDNIASQITVTVRTLRDIGVAARGIAFAGVVTSNEIIETPRIRGNPSSLRARRDRIAFRARVLQAIRWSDVVHWHYRFSMRRAIDLKWAQVLRRRRIVEFWGSDIRIPEIEAADNPYYARVFRDSEVYGAESFTESRRRQEIFARHGAEALTSCHSMFPYIQRDLFPRVHFVRQRVYLADYAPQYSEATARPMIVHSPTAPIAKGTPAVLAAIEQLQRTHQYDFRLIQGMPHAEAKALMRNCDIFVDQFVIGGHGLAALEAMAFGKPVVCYIKPSMYAKYPPELPIVNATMETLPETLARLIEDGALRRELGRRGREYVERYHDAHMLARQLVEIYQSH